MKLAVLFDCLGPYHQARLAAISQICDLLAVEFGSKSREYAWKRESAQEFRCRSVNPSGTGAAMPLSEFKHILSGILDEFSPEVIAIPGWSKRGAFLAMRWAIDHSVPVVVMSDSTALDAVRNPIYETIKRFYLKSASAALVGGEPHRDYLVQLGVSVEDIALGYDCVDNAYFYSGSQRVREEAVSYRKSANLPVRYFLASARFISKKNLQGLIEAFGAYRSAHIEGEPWDLVVLGDGELRPQIEETVRREKLDACVHLPGFKQYQELPIYYSLADAFVHASTTEQWGLVVNEAMASGLPVIVSNRCGCARDLVVEGENGWTFEPSQQQALAAKLLEISKLSDVQREEMGCASRRIIKDWGPERFAGGLQRAAEVAVAKGPREASLTQRLILELLARKK